MIEYVIPGGFFTVFATLIAKQKRWWDLIPLTMMTFVLWYGLSFAKADAVQEEYFDIEYVMTHEAPNAQQEIARMLGRTIKNHPMEKRNDYWREPGVSAKLFRECGDRFWKEAEERCWYLPERSQKQNCTQMFAQFAVWISSGTPLSKCAMAFGTFLIDYGYDSLEEFREIKTLQHWAQYHYEMAEFYEYMEAHKSR